MSRQEFTKFELVFATGDEKLFEESGQEGFEKAVKMGFRARRKGGAVRVCIGNATDPTQRGAGLYYDYQLLLEPGEPVRAFRMDWSEYSYSIDTTDALEQCRHPIDLSALLTACGLQWPEDVDRPARFSEREDTGEVAASFVKLVRNISDRGD